MDGYFPSCLLDDHAGMKARGGESIGNCQPARTAAHILGHSRELVCLLEPPGMAHRQPAGQSPQRSPTTGESWAREKRRGLPRDLPQMLQIVLPLEQKDIRALSHFAE